MIVFHKSVRWPIAVHLLLCAALTGWISSEMLLSRTGTVTTSGIMLAPHEPGSSSRELTIVDFPSHLNFVKKAWLGETTVKSGSSIYSLENHLKVTSDRAGIKLGNALPFGYSPTMLLMIAPLVCFPHFIALHLFNMAGLFGVWWTTHPGRCRLGVGLLAFFSPLAHACFSLGQTALLTGAGLLFIAEKSREGRRKGGWSIPVLTGAALWALTAKPPLALTAGAVLVGLRQWRPLIVAAILSVCTTLAVTPLLGLNWAGDYLATAT